MKSAMIFAVIGSLVMLVTSIGSSLSPVKEDRVARMVYAEAGNQSLRTQAAIAYVIMSAAINAGKTVDDAVALQSNSYLSSWLAALNKDPHMSRIYFGEAIPYGAVTVNAVRTAYRLINYIGPTEIFHFDDCKQSKQFLLIGNDRIKWKNGLISFKVESDSDMCIFSDTMLQAEEFLIILSSLTD